MHTAPSLLAQGALRRLGVGIVHHTICTDDDRILVIAWGGATLRRTLDGAVLWEVDCPASCGVLQLPQGRVLLYDPVSGRLESWDLATGHQLGPLDGVWPGCKALTARPDGELLALVTADGHVLLLSGQDGLERERMAPLAGMLRSLAFSPDGLLLAVASLVVGPPRSSGSVTVWDLAERRVVHQLQIDSRMPFVGRDLQFSPDGRFVAALGVSDLQRWDLVSARHLLPLSDPPTAGTHFSFSPDGRTLALGTAGGDRDIGLWDHQEGRLLGSLPQAEELHSLAFGPGGDTLVATTRSGSLALWDLRTAQLRWQQVPEAAICAYATWIPGAYQILVVASTDRLLLWDSAGPDTPRPVPSALPAGTCHAVGPDGRWLAMGTTASFDARAALAERLYTAMAMRGGVLWRVDLAGIEPPRQLLERPAWITALAYTPGADLLVVATSDGELSLVEPETGRVLRRFAGHEGTIWSVDVSPQGDLLASAGADGLVRCWGLDGSELLRLEGPAKGGRTPLRFSPDGQQLAFGGPDHTLGVWEVPSGRSVLRLEQAGRWVGGLDFSPDGRILAAGDERGVVGLWEVPGGRSIARMEGHTTMVASIGFHPDGTMLVTGSGDGTVRIWRSPGAPPR